MLFGQRSHLSCMINADCSCLSSTSRSFCYIFEGNSFLWLQFQAHFRQMTNLGKYFCREDHPMPWAPFSGNILSDTTFGDQYLSFLVMVVFHVQTIFPRRALIENCFWNSFLGFRWFSSSPNHFTTKFSSHYENFISLALMHEASEKTDFSRTSGFPSLARNDFFCY